MTILAAISYEPIPLFEIGPLSLSLHGLFAALGFLAGAVLMTREVRRRRFDDEAVQSILTWGLVAALLGARLFTVPAHITDPGYGLGDVLGLAGDFSILGGYAGGVIGGVLRMRMLDINVPVHLDMAAAGMAIGAVVGRIGDLALVEHLGSPTSFFLGYTVKPGYDLAPQHDALECTVESAVNGICGTFHPTALYDMLGAILLLGALIWLGRAWTNRHYGQLFGVWALWYGLQRFLVDFTRLDAAEETGTSVIADSVIGPFTGSQWGALLAAGLGAGLIWWARARMQTVSPETDVTLGATPIAVDPAG
ncbi:MAG: hypothetical protein HKP18_02390 [Acidimicrobiia bacterium]|nr:hypothetical protein [Acidimicrobiia bacterium]